MRDWSRRNAEKVRETARASRNRRIEYVREYDRKRGHRPKPEAELAHGRVAEALKRGRLEKGPCEREAEGICRGQIEGHHEDYAKALDVRWLCHKHHMEVHRVF